MTKILVGSQKLFESKTVLAGASTTSDIISIDDNFDRMTITAHASKAGTLEILALLNDLWYTAVTIPLVANTFNVANNYLFFPKVRFKFTAGIADSVISCDENITKHVAN